MTAKTKAWADANIERELRGQATPAYPLTVYLALFTTATDQDSNGTELTAGVGYSYARQQIIFDDALGGNQSANSAAVIFSNMPPATVGWAAIMSASTGGTMMYQAALAASKTTAGGESLVFDVGEITVQLD